MAPLVAQRRLNISTSAQAVGQLNRSLLYCVWRIPFQLHTMHAHAAHIFMPTCFRFPHMRCNPRSPSHASAFQHVTTCRACGSGAQWRPVISPFVCSVLSWRPTHPGQLKPTTLPLRRLAPDSCSVGLSPTLSLPFSPALSLAPHSLSLSSLLLLSVLFPLHPTLSLSLSPSLSPKKKGGCGSFGVSLSPPGVRTILYRTEEVCCIHWATTIGYLHHVLQSFFPTPSCVSSPVMRIFFRWGRAQQRVEEPHSVPGYRVRLPEERSLEQP